MDVISSSGSEGSSKRGVRVLVVDDDATIRMIHSKMLKKVIGITDPVAVGNGKEAIDLFSSGHQFDLVLMDRDMPVMDGIQATMRLREMGVGSTIVGISTNSVEEAQEFMEAGLDEHVEKPLTIPKLTSLLQKINLNRSPRST